MEEPDENELARQDLENELSDIQFSIMDALNYDGDEEWLTSCSAIGEKVEEVEEERSDDE